MAIEIQEYSPEDGEMIYTITAEVSGEQFSLAVRPKGKVNVRIFVWKGDRQDPEEQKILKSDPVDFSYEKSREKVYEQFAKVFGVKPWVREVLESLNRNHEEYLKEELNKLRAKREKDPELQALPGHHPPIYRTPEGYRIEQGTVGELYELCNFSARFLEDLLVFDGSGEIKRLFRLQSYFMGEHKRFDVSAESFERLTWVPKELGPLAHYEGYRSRPLVAKAIKLESRLAGGVPKVRLYKHTGWVKFDENHWGYLHGGGVITGRKDVSLEGARVELTGDKLERRIFPSYCLDPKTQSFVEDRKKSVEQSFDLWDLSNDRVAIPLMLSVYRAAMGQVDYNVHISGKTGYGKTTLAHLAVSHFGPELLTKDKVTFAATKYGIEKVASNCKDQLLIVDDYRGSTEHKDILDHVMRGAAEGSGRTRFVYSHSKVEDNPPRALLLSTGEDLPVGESLNARILSLKMGESDKLIDPDTKGALEALKAAQDAAGKGIYAKALAGFVRWIAPRYGSILSSLESKRNEFGHEVRSEVAHPRTASLYGDLRLALEAYLDFAVEVGAVTKRMRSSLEKRARVAVLSAIHEQAEYVTSDDPVERYRELLGLAISRSEAYVVSPEGERGKGVVVGWETDEGLYLKGQASLDAARRMAQGLGEPFVITSKTLYQRVFDARWLLSTSRKEGRATTTVRKKFDGSMQTCLHLKREFIS